MFTFECSSFRAPPEHKAVLLKTKLVLVSLCSYASGFSRDDQTDSRKKKTQTGPNCISTPVEFSVKLNYGSGLKQTNAPRDPISVGATLSACVVNTEDFLICIQIGRAQFSPCFVDLHQPVSEFAKTEQRSCVSSLYEEQLLSDFK